MTKERLEREQKLEDLQKQAQDEYLAVQKTKGEVQHKERRLEEERKTIRLQSDSAASKHQKDLERANSQGTTKLLVASAVCFLMGMAVAIYVFNGGAVSP